MFSAVILLIINYRPKLVKLDRLNFSQIFPHKLHHLNNLLKLWIANTWLRILKYANFFGKFIKIF